MVTGKMVRFRRGFQAAYWVPACEIPEVVRFVRYSWKRLANVECVSTRSPVCSARRLLAQLVVAATPEARLVLGQDALGDLAINIGETKVSAGILISQSGVIETN